MSETALSIALSRHENSTAAYIRLKSFCSEPSKWRWLGPVPVLPLKASFDATPPRETLVGSVERVTFHNDDNGFAVLKVKARGKRDLVPVVGHVASISAGEYIHAVGVWITDRSHGLQFKADFLKTTPPTTAEGIEKYLGSGMVRGIGPKLAERIVAAFGAATFEIIEASPEKLREVSGIGEFRAGKIAAGWAEQKAIRDIMVFLHANGVGTSRAVRIFKTYGHDAIQVMTEDPYRLARDIRGIGFRTADAIAMKLGMTREAPQRVRAGISFALQEATDEGHCGLPVEDLIKLATTLLEVDPAIIRTALTHELSGGEVVADTIGDRPCVFLRGLYLAERGIAERLLALAKGSPSWPVIDVDKAIPWVEKKTGKTLAASQRAAIEMVLRSKVAVVTGGPGVGKTTLLDAILRILAAKGTKILLAAPTGRAAKRMTEQTGIEAKTIRRLLETDPKNGGFKRNAENPLDCDLLVVDETSMVDTSLMFAVMKAVPLNSGLLLVGDVDQLPSVGPGQILGDIIGSGAIPVARLTEVFRQAAESRIVVNAHRINRGEMPEWPKPGENSDFWFVDAEDPEKGATKVVEIGYKNYSRDHAWRFDNGIEVLGSAASAYLGNPQRVDPEFAFVAALSSRHMLTFLALASNKGFVVDGYEDNAVGFLEKNANGKLAMTRVDLHPEIAFSGVTQPTQADLDWLHDKAHRECFIANSVTTQVRVLPAK